MGCDIHMYIEKKIGNYWFPAQGFMITDEDRVPDVPYPDRFHDRDYELFGFLAGVRDYGNNQYFSEKGFPDDASPEVSRVFKSWGPDVHTPSYLTLKELNGIPWEDRMMTYRGMFKEDQLEKYRASLAENKPDFSIITEWCQWTGVPGWVIAEIPVPLKVTLSRFKDFVYWLHSYDWRCNEDEIRIVFWFDN